MLEFTPTDILIFLSLVSKPEGFNPYQIASRTGLQVSTVADSLDRNETPGFIVCHEDHGRRTYSIESFAKYIRDLAVVTKDQNLRLIPDPTTATVQIRSLGPNTVDVRSPSSTFGLASGEPTTFTRSVDDHVDIEYRHGSAVIRIVKGRAMNAV